uniref:Uncharacterized protein n=1 Tax=Meloidogyne enterolobii TaxID=390850 RepID=A0A6V7WNV3_MELEN|nr:unnamed protein product [Meloidogyne enterolobii]
MDQEGLSPNSDWILVEKEGNDFEKIETISDNIQKNFEEEKEKTVNLKRKNNFLENELKEMDKKIQKINSDHKNEIEEIKRNLQKLIEENNKQIKAENDICLQKKDEKINFLEEEIKKTNDLFEKKLDDLIKLNNLTRNKSVVNFIKIKNKWSEIEYICKCCANKCINIKPIGKCINGYGNLINDEYIKYINCLEGLGKNAIVSNCAENLFKKPKNCFNYSLYYFEIECIFEGELNAYGKWMDIGLENCSTNKWIRFSAEFATIYDENNEEFELDNISWKNKDIFGCGLVYPQLIK